MKTALGAPDPGDGRRNVHFYDSVGLYSHSADVRFVGKKFKKPHQGDLNKNYKKANGRQWEIGN